MRNLTLGAATRCKNSAFLPPAGRPTADFSVHQQPSNSRQHGVDSKVMLRTLINGAKAEH
jgi:hypothetical protein